MGRPLGGETPREFLPDPAAYPLGSVESRAAARQILDALKTRHYVIHTDDNDDLIYEPGVNYATHVVAVPREMTSEQWLAQVTGPDDPAEREVWRRESDERLKRQQDRWRERMRARREFEESAWGEPGDRG